MKRTILSAFLIIVLVVVYAIGALYVPAQQQGVSGRLILADRSLFDKEVADSFTPPGQVAGWEKFRFSLFKERQPKFADIKQKYGDADFVRVEKSPKIAADVDIEAYRQRQEFPPVEWQDVTVYYYGDIGFGVEADSETVSFVTTKAEALDVEPEKPKAASPIQEEQRAIVPAAGNFDGNWQDTTGALRMIFTVTDNTITQAALLNLRTNVCDDSGGIFAAYTPPVAIEGNILDLDVNGSTGSNVWLVSVSGEFSSDNTVSGRQSALILGRCGFTSGTANFSITKAPDYVLFATPSSRNIVFGESTTYAVGMSPLGNFNQPIQLELIAPTVAGITYSLSSTTLQPNATVRLTVNAAANATSALIAIGLGSSTGATSHLTIVNLDVSAFELMVSPEIQTIAKGQSATFTLNSRTVAFTTPATLSASPPGSSGITVNFAAPMLVPGQSTTFTATSSSTTSLATHSISITAQAGQIREFATARLRVSDPDFELAITPATQRVGPGDTATVMVQVNPLLGFTQPVNLSAAVTPNNGNLTASLASGTVNPGGSATLTLRAAQAAPQNSTYTVTVTGTSGSLSHTATVQVTIVGPDFSLAFNPASVTGARGTTVKGRLEINRVGGFTGDVTITPSPTSGVKVKPSEVVTNDSGATIKFKIKGSVPVGAQDILFTGRDSAGKQRTARVTVIIQ